MVNNKVGCKNPTENNILNIELIILKAGNKGLSMNQLALRCGISKSYFYRLLNGENKNPSIKVLLKIAEVLKLDVKQLIIKE